MAPKTKEKTSKSPKKQPKFLYTQEAMNNAINAVKQQNLSILKASKQFGVPRSTLINKINNKTPNIRRMGPSTILTNEEEERLVHWILNISKVGFPLVREDVLSTVHHIVTEKKQSTPFTNNRPGKKWFKLFLARHPILAERTPEMLTSTKAEVSVAKIRAWFQEIQDWLCANNYENILQQPQRIFNCDESAFMLCPKSGKVLALKGSKDIYEVFQGNDKESLTTLITIRADGKVCPPFILYPYKRLPSDLVNSVPKHWAVGKNESGWMTGETFFEFITNIFYPWLRQNDTKFPVILYIDGHKSHLTLHLSEFCNKNDIILVALPPNTTHILQPCDVSLFKGMKQSWKQVVHEWRIKNSRIPVTKVNFAQLFEIVINKISQETVTSGFKRTGLYPFDPEAVDYTKCSRAPRIHKMSTDILKEKVVDSLKVMESFISKDLLDEFYAHFSQKKNWKGSNDAIKLYEVWHKMKYQTLEENMSADTVNLSTDPALENEIEIQNNPPATDDYDFVGCNVTISSFKSETQAQDIIESDCMPTSSQLPVTSEITDERSTSPFKKALFWPEPKQIKNRKIKEKIPAVAISNEWRKYFRTKEEEKKKKELEKEQRKIERENRKRKQSENTKLGKKRKMKRNPEFEQTAKKEENTSTITLEKECYYAVFYEEKYYLGRLIDLKDETCDIKFLQEILENKYTWPTKADIANVAKDYIFYGPLDMIGNDPFTVDTDIIKRIKMLYRDLKCKK